MSIPSYRRNVGRGVTGHNTNTCFPAALEQVSPYCHLEPSTYRKYARFMGAWQRLKDTDPWSVNPIYKDLIGQMALELGGFEFDDVYFERVDSYREFSTEIRKLMRHEYRVAVDIQLEGYGDLAHPVGLIPLGDEESYRLVSTWVPYTLRGEVGLRDIFEHLDFVKDPPRQRFPFNNTNITALPPAV